MSLLSLVESRRALVVLFLLGAAVRAILLPRPVDQPSWRECDLAGIARNYYREGMNLFYPRVDWRGNTPGYAEMEFPVYPWTMAALYHVFGCEEVIGRVLSYLASMLALVIFFRLAREVLSPLGAFFAGLFFMLSPLAVELSTAIQPEPFMLLGILLAVFYFLRWLRTDGMGAYFAAIAATAGAILAKTPAAHLGILFAVLLLASKGWRSLLSPLPWLFAVGALTPPLLWYNQARNFWLTYGNSLGVSNEYHWVGIDLFTTPEFIVSFAKLEIGKVWAPTGIILGCLGAIQVRSSPAVRLALAWLGSAFAFYLVAFRTTSSGWAYYYHIASVPPAILLMAAGADLGWRSAAGRPVWTFLMASVMAGVLFWDTYGLVRLANEKRTPSDIYGEAMTLRPMLVEPGLVLVPGGPSLGRTGFPVANNASFLFYWLDRKGFNLAADELTMTRLHWFENHGVRYVILEKAVNGADPDFATQVRKNYSLVGETATLLAYRLGPSENQRSNALPAGGQQ